MATIKIRRGAGQPSITSTGLTAYEPAWDTTNNRFFINNGSTAMWIGAAVIQDTTLSGNCAWTIPTQNSVKTYVDNSVSAGAVSSVNGATGAITIGAGTGISIATSTAARGITVTNVGVTGLTGTVNQITVSGTTGSITLSLPSTIVAPGSLAVTGLLNPLAGISANGGMTLAGFATIIGGVDMKAGITVGGSAVFTSAASFGSGVTIQNGLNLTSGRLNVTDGICASGGMTLQGGSITIQGPLSVSENSSFLKALNVTLLFSAAGGISAAGGLTIDSVYTRGPLSVDGAATLLGGFDAKGATFGNIVKFNAGLSAASIFVTGGATFNGNIYAPNLVTSVDGVTGAVDLLAGTGLSITVPTGTAKGITLTNIGVVGITGTANQVSVSGTSGSVTLSLPSAITTPGSLATTTTLSVGSDLTVTGNLTVNGTTTTVNSTTVTVQDPLIAIGGVTANAPPPVGDTKDRGILFQWGDGTAGRTGFFGLDRSTGRFTFLPLGVSVSGEVVTGTAGNAEFAGIFAPQGILNLTGLSGSNASITIAGSSAGESTSVAIKARTTTFGVDSSLPILALNDGNGIFGRLQLVSTLTADRSYSLPDISGQMVLADTAGATSGWLLRGQGSSTQNTWINPQSSGFTAFAATNAENLRLTATSSNTNFNLTFATGNSGLQLQYADLSNNLTWNPSSATMVLAGGKGFLEGIIEGGTF